MVELGRLPCRRIVTKLTCLRECASHVVWSLGTLVVRQMAGNASRNRDVVVIVRMAKGTGRGQVESGKRPACRCVVKRCWLPGRRIVAKLAGLREPSSHVVRSFCALIIRQVTGNARRHRNVVVVVDVAKRAGRGLVEPGERPTRGRVVKLGGLPRGRVVAKLARRWDPAGHVIRGLRRLIFIQMAGNARRYRKVVIVVRMARCARSRRMRASQRPARSRVVK